MNDARADPRPERTVYLVMLGVAPAIWMLHFLASYVTAAVWCARVAGPGGPLDGVRAAIASYTVVALIGIALVGWSGYRRHRHGTEVSADDSDDTPAARERFLGFATLLLASLSAFATAFAGISALLFHTCH